MILWKGAIVALVEFDSDEIPFASQTLENYRNKKKLWKNMETRFLFNHCL